MENWTLVELFLTWRIHPSHGLLLIVLNKLFAAKHLRCLLLYFSRVFVCFLLFRKYCLLLSRFWFTHTSTFQRLKHILREAGLTRSNHPDLNTRNLFFALFSSSPFGKKIPFLIVLKRCLHFSNFW